MNSGSRIGDFTSRISLDESASSSREQLIVRIRRHSDLLFIAVDFESTRVGRCQRRHCRPTVGGVDSDHRNHRILLDDLSDFEPVDR